MNFEVLSFLAENNGILEIAWQITTNHKNDGFWFVIRVYDSEHHKYDRCGFILTNREIELHKDDWDNYFMECLRDALQTIRKRKEIQK